MRKLNIRNWLKEKWSSLKHIQCFLKDVYWVNKCLKVEKKFIGRESEENRKNKLLWHSDVGQNDEFILPLRLEQKNMKNINFDAFRTIIGSIFFCFT